MTKYGLFALLLLCATGARAELYALNFACPERGNLGLFQELSSDTAVRQAQKQRLHHFLAELKEGQKEIATLLCRKGIQRLSFLENCLTKEFRDSGVSYELKFKEGSIQQSFYNSSAQRRIDDELRKTRPVVQLVGETEVTVCYPKIIRVLSRRIRYNVKVPAPDSEDVEYDFTFAESQEDMEKMLKGWAEKGWVVHDAVDSDVKEIYPVRNLLNKSDLDQLFWEPAFKSEKSH